MSRLTDYRCCRKCGAILAGTTMRAQYPDAPHRPYCPYSADDLQVRLLNNAERIAMSAPHRHP